MWLAAIDPALFQITIRPDVLFPKHPLTIPASMLCSSLLRLLVQSLPCFSAYAGFFCEDKIGVMALDLWKEYGED